MKILSSNKLYNDVLENLFGSFNYYVTNIFCIMVRTTRRSNKSQSKASFTAHTCAFCKSVFASARGLGIHMSQHCPNARRKENGNDSSMSRPSTKKRKITEEQDVLNNNEEVGAVTLEDFSHNITDFGLLNQFEDLNGTIGADDTSAFSPEQMRLWSEQEQFLKVSTGANNIWPINDLAKIELMQTLNRHGCPHTLYADIIKWAQHYNGRPGFSLFQKETGFEKRETFFKRLGKKVGMTKLQPTMKELIYSNGIKIPITTFNFSDQLLSLFRDKHLMDSKNLVLGASSLSSSSPGDNVSEVQDSMWYQTSCKYFNDRYGEDPSRIVCGIILTIDKTHTDSKGKLCLEPVDFTLSIFNKHIRRTRKTAWRTLGFINDLSAGIYDEICHDESNFESMAGTTGLTKSAKKSIIYHQMLNIILDSLRSVQETGLVWKFETPNQQEQYFNLVFPLCFCIVDMKGGKQLCGMYDANNVSRPCISCYSSQEQLDNSSTICRPVKSSDVIEVIREQSDPQRLQKLKDISQHPLLKNAFFDMCTGGWPYGIWGMCPTEVLHQFYEGMVNYALTEFFEEVLSPTHVRNLERVLRCIVKASKNQSNRFHFPITSFGMGISKLSKMKGIEKHAAVFFLSIFLHTQVSRTHKFGGGRSMDSSFVNKLKEWRKLFEKFLYYHDWLMQPSFKKSELVMMESCVKNLHILCRRLIQRNGNGISGIPKFHELFHVIRDIYRFGPAVMFDSCITEGHHHYQKLHAQRTQRRISQFSSQTGVHLLEDQLIHGTWNYLNNSDPSFSYMSNRKVSPPKKYKFGGRYTAYVENDSVLFKNEEKKNNLFFANLQSTKDFTGNLRRFFMDRLFSLMDSRQDKVIPCYASLSTNNFVYKGYSRKVSEHPSWAEFIWMNSSQDEFSVPGKIIMFLDFKNIRFQQEYRHLYPQNEYHVIIESLRSSVNESARRNVHQPICQSCVTENVDYQFHCVSVMTLQEPCFIIPDFASPSNDDELEQRKYLYVYNRNYHMKQIETCGSTNDGQEVNGSS